MPKTIFILMLASLLFLTFNPIISYAQEIDTAAEEVEAETEITAQDLGIGEPRVLPTNPFYILKSAWRGIRLLTATSAEKKAELQLKFANEKLIELKKLAERTETKQEVIQKQLENYQNDLEGAKEQLEKISPEREEIKNKFQEKYLEQNLKHQLILQKLANQVPAQTYEIIEQNREQHLERFKEVMENVAEKQDVKEKIENTIQEVAETRPLIRLQAAEVLKDIKEKVPEALKVEIQAIEAENIKSAAEAIKKIIPEKREEILEKHLGDMANPISAVEIAEEIKRVEPILAPVIEAVKARPVENLIINRLEPLNEEKREAILEKIIEQKSSRIEVLEQVQARFEKIKIEKPTEIQKPAPPTTESELPKLELKREQEQKQILPEKEIQPPTPTTETPTYQPMKLLEKIIDKEKVKTRVQPILKPQSTESTGSVQTE